MYVYIIRTVRSPCVAKRRGNRVQSRCNVLFASVTASAGQTILSRFQESQKLKTGEKPTNETGRDL
jgi:hypothetical protein